MSEPKIVEPTLPKTPKFLAAEASLPEELRPVFRELAIDYRFSAATNHGHAFISAPVIADLVRAGWRKSVTS